MKEIMKKETLKKVLKVSQILHGSSPPMEMSNECRESLTTMKTNWEKVGLSYNKELGEDEFIYQGIVEKEDRAETHSVKVPISIISAILDSLVMEEKDERMGQCKRCWADDYSVPCTCGESDKDAIEWNSCRTELLSRINKIKGKL